VKGPGLLLLDLGGVFDVDFTDRANWSGRVGFTIPDIPTPRTFNKNVIPS